MVSVRRVWLIRHAESGSNAGLPSGDPASIPLTELGRRQAERIARAFTEAPALIVTSPYLRARQTAQPTIDRFPEAGREIWPVQEFTYIGDLHGRVMTSKEREPYVRAYWERADPHQAIGGAESFAGLLDRAHDCLKRLADQECGPTAVFTHGLFIRAVLWSLPTGVSAADGEAMRRFRNFADIYLVPNGGVAELQYTDRGAPRLLGAITWAPSLNN